MFLPNLFVNVLLFFIGVIYVMSAKRDAKRKYYPRWFIVLEYIGGIFFCVFGFTVWFI